jgi:hypothetical protein
MFLFSRTLQQYCNNNHDVKIKHEWFINHYRHIVHKLASYECRFPIFFSNR